MAAKFFSAILVYSQNAERLSTFYRDVLGIPLEEERHGNSPPHYGCEIGDLHFAIHQAESGKKPGVGSVNMAFEVFDIDSHMRELARQNVKIISEPRDLGFMKLAVIEDPDGNAVEFTELSSGWIDHLKNRRAEGHDLIVAWEAQKTHSK